MQFNLQSSGDANIVRACSAHEIRVREHVIRRSTVLTADKIVFDWPPASVRDLSAADLQAVLALEPEIILLGTGARQVFPPAEIRSLVQRSGIGFEVMDTRAACRTYNLLVQEGRRVAAALIVGEAPAPAE